jgi:hypothetical protein
VPPTLAGQELNETTKTAMRDIARDFQDFAFINDHALKNSATLRTALRQKPDFVARSFLALCLQDSRINDTTNKDCCGEDSTLSEIIREYDDEGVLTRIITQGTS